jgi:hypothetical protein
MGNESAGYLLAGQASELERLQLQSRVWEPSGRRLLEEIGGGDGASALDFGCGVLGWLRVLSEWVADAPTTRWRRTCGSLAPAAPSCSRTRTPEPGTSTPQLPLSRS